ncbi:MAG: hypothetical protein ACLP36_15695, partial [Acidimicrobiales bacterium]
MWIAMGRLREARRWAREAGLSPEDELSYLGEFEHITLARLVLAAAKAEGRVAEGVQGGGGGSSDVCGRRPKREPGWAASSRS